MGDLGTRRPSCGVEGIESGFNCLGWDVFWGDSVWDFGNKGLVFDEGVIGERLRSTDSEPDERQRDPVVQFLDNTASPRMASFTTM